MPDKIDLFRTSPPNYGEIQAMIIGSKIITVKDKYTFDGSVHVNNVPETGGKIGKCIRCGAEFKWGGKE